MSVLCECIVLKLFFYSTYYIFLCTLYKLLAMISDVDSLMITLKTGEKRKKLEEEKGIIIRFVIGHG